MYKLIIKKNTLISIVSTTMKFNDFDYLWRTLQFYFHRLKSNERFEVYECDKLIYSFSGKDYHE